MTDAAWSPEQEHALREIAHRWMRAGWQRPDRAAFHELHDPAFIDRSASGRRASVEGFWTGVMELYAAFPDFYATAEDFVVEPQTGKMSVRWSATGIQRGEFLGIPATGRAVHFEGIEIIRAADGRIAERWGEWNGIEILQQLRQLGQV